MNKKEEQIDAWNGLYGSHGRQWRGVSDIDLPIPPGSDVIDIGCGNGKTSAALIEMGYNVTGVDFSENAINHCAETFPEMRCICSSSDAIPLEDDSFDCAVMVHLLEHLDDDEIKNTVTEVIRILKPHGMIFVRSFGKEDMRSGTGMIVDGFELRNGIRYRYFDENEMKKMFSELNVLHVRTIKQDTKFGTSRIRVEGLFEKK